MLAPIAVPALLPPRRSGECVRPTCHDPVIPGGYLCQLHEDEQALLRVEQERLDFLDFRARGLEKSRATLPPSMVGITLADERLPRLLAPATWKRSPAHAAARARRLIAAAGTHPSFVIRGPLHAGGTALGCATLGTVLANYEPAGQNTPAAALGNQAVYLAAGAVVRARLGHHHDEPPEVDAFDRAGFLVLDGLGTETKADRITDLLDERLREERPLVVVTSLTAEEAKHRYGDVGDALFHLPILDLTTSMGSVPEEYAWARFDAVELPDRVGVVLPNGRRDCPENYIAAAREAVEEALSGERKFHIFAGVAGGGKTTLAVAMGTEMVERDPSLSFLFVDAYELQRAADPRPFGGALVEDPILSEARNADVLVLDEAGAEKIPRDKASVVAELLHHRHKRGAITILTTPKSAKDLHPMYGDGIMRRIADRTRTRTIRIGEKPKET